jgi:adenosylhomocysteine nucleosidase
MAVPQESNGLIEAIAEKSNLKLFYTGIGLLAAAQYNPSHILNLGTAGSRHIEVGRLIECTKFVNRTTNILPMLTTYYFAEPMTDLEKGDCGSADFIDFTEAAEQFTVLDMEAYAMAFVCHQMNVKFNSFKYVTDNSKGEVGKKWREHLSSGAIALSKQLERLLKTKVLT